MFVKLLLISIFVVVLVLLALGLKLWFDPKAEFTVHSCARENSSLNEDGTCPGCRLKDLSDCPVSDKTTNDKNEQVFMDR
ncbi:MAG: hypothetical protein JXA61_00345 [Bacteroidales bacterium]|nr:hypothetical protein [Bacteroidales bacterium]